MNDSLKQSGFTLGEVHNYFVPANDYTSAEFLQLEYQRMWPKVWQVACREEEVPKAGNYVTYDIGDQSIIVIRTAEGKLKAFYNVCLHRGRRLVDDICGKTARFTCSYHGWQYDLDGRNIRVHDKDDWQGCPSMNDEDLRMHEMLVDVWAGFVFINMDTNAEPLRKFLDPVPEYLDCFELEVMRYRWYVSIKVPCNWKACTEAFTEGYHVFTTHPQWPPLVDDVTRTSTFGKHGMFGYPTARMFGQPCARISPPLDDVRENLIAFYDDLNTTLAALYSERATEAARRLRTEVEPNTPNLDVVVKLYQFIREACEACGAGWPNITLEQMAKAGADWHIFPHLVILPQPDAALVYRSRPYFNDPDWCIFDVWSLQRYAPGAQPVLNRRIFRGDDAWERIGDVSPVLMQDFSNIVAVQQGMKSYGFAGCRTNPLQESTVSNFHRVIREYF